MWTGVFCNSSCSSSFVEIVENSGTKVGGGGGSGEQANLHSDIDIIASNGKNEISAGAVNYEQGSAVRTINFDPDMQIMF